ncbi:MAG: hypothetical protein LAO22_00540 [Acidobacteriia bacterium]|nr:hypothetical protein [Terriglobia bacterium]
MPSKTASKQKAAPDPDPYVIVDFVFDRGLLSIAIKNIGSRPAFGVRVEFSHKLMGVEGTVEVSALPLFSALEFLPGGKEISTFLDSSASYFRSQQPEQITTRISYQDARGGRFTNAIHHNLEIYRAIGYGMRASGEE